jgi:D-alanyl-D-alanine carboxypeptidase (penicillin-binding protein 5/6)
LITYIYLSADAAKTLENTQILLDLIFQFILKTANQKMTRKILFGGLVYLIGCTLTFTGTTLQAASHQISASSGTKSAPSKTAGYQAYLVLDATSGKILEEANGRLKWPPASIAKLMLTYIVMEKIYRAELKLSDPVTVSRKAAAIGGSQVYLKEGEVFSLEDLMRATLIESANDAAYAIGEYVAGSKEEFIRLMNAKARSLHMQDTEFHSIHGLPPSKGQLEDVTTCRDLAILAEALLKYPIVLQWTSVRRSRFRNGTFIMTSGNRLLSKMPEIDGLKTGYYRRAGHNIVATAKKGNLRLVVIVLGSPTAGARDAFVKEKINRYFRK